MNPLRKLSAQSESYISDVLVNEVLFKVAQMSSQRSVNYEKLCKNVGMSRKIMKFIGAIAFLFIASLPYFDPGGYSYSAVFVGVVFILMMLGLSFSYSFYSVDLSYLHTLPLTRQEISRIHVLMFIKYFDWPLLVAFLSITIAAALRNPLSILPAIVGFLSVVSITMTILVFLGKKSSRLSLSSSIAGSILRSIVVFTWSLSMYGGYLAFILLTRTMKLANAKGYAFIFPLPFGMWIQDPGNVYYITLSLPYIILACVGVYWMSKNLPLHHHARIEVVSREWELKIRSKMLAMVLKDFKVLFRNPQLVVVALLPVIQALLYVLIFKQGVAGVMGITTLQVMITVTVSTFMSVERGSYISTLPITEREFVFSKVISSMIFYLASFVTVVVLSSGSVLSKLSIFPSGVAVILTTVMLTKDHTGEPINPRAVLSIIAALVLTLLPVFVGGLTFIFLKKFALAAATTSMAEMLGAMIFFFKKVKN